MPPFRRKKFQIKQRWLAKAGHLCRRSFFHKVFPHIQCAGKQDDSALDEVLQILRHTHHGQTHEDQPQHDNADNDTSDLTDAAHEGHAADDAGRDPRWARMWENYGEDCYVNAEMVYRP